VSCCYENLALGTGEMCSIPAKSALQQFAMANVLDYSFTLDRFDEITSKHCKYMNNNLYFVMLSTISIFSTDDSIVGSSMAQINSL
jgi:hypothetical protein